MITAKCIKCGGSATGDTFEEASSKINHAVGMSRGIKCGANYNCVSQVDDSTPKTQDGIPSRIQKEVTHLEPKESIPVEKPKESPSTKESPVEVKPKSTKSKSKK